MHDNIFSLQGRTALVTGAGTGLGAHFAQVLASAGATLVLAARREDKLRDTAAAIAAAGGEAHCYRVDVTDSTSVAALFDQCAADPGLPDVIINNAGISHEALLHEMDEADWDAVLDINLKGVHLVASEAARASAAAGTAAPA